MTNNYGDDDDLGLGNSSARKGKQDNAQAQYAVPSKPTTPAPTAEKSENETDEKKEGDDKQGNSKRIPCVLIRDEAIALMYYLFF
jgi:hypothetical protein